MPDAAPASHAGYGCPDKITRPFYRPYPLLLPSYHSPREGATPLCYFLGEKVTQKHFHTAAPLGRQYESAFARSRGFFSINLCFTIYNFFIKLCRNFYIIVI